MSDRLVLVDASVYVFRAWHSMPDDLRDAEGRPLNAVQGFARFLLDLLERTRPRHLLVAFDEALESSFRNELYPLYKANREPAPDELKWQFGACQRLTRALGLPALSDSRFEADDLIGSALQRARDWGMSGLIVSADKDLSQLLRAGDEQWDLARDQRWGADGVYARYGALPERIPDFLGLAGDSVDNIPGVPGVGAKTASALLDHFGDLDTLLRRVDEIEFLRSIRGAKSHAARLKQHAELARLSRQLATIATDAPVPGEREQYRPRVADPDEIDATFAAMRLGPMSRRRALAWRERCLED